MTAEHRADQDKAALSPAQYDGTACVVCARDYLTEPVSHVPIAVIDGGQVFACTECVTCCSACRGDRRRYHEMPGSGGERYWDDCETCEGTGWEVAQ